MVYVDLWGFKLASDVGGWENVCRVCARLAWSVMIGPEDAGDWISEGGLRCGSDAS